MSGLGSGAALIVALAAIAVVVIYTLRSGAPPTPTSRSVRRALLELVFDATADRKIPSGPIYELGAGWGGLADAVARRAPTRTVVGWEISPLPWLVARLRQMVMGPANLTYRRGNFFDADLSEAAIVLLYLHRPLMEQLAPKLARELPPGAVVASNFFEMPGWTPQEIVRADDLYSSPIYLYRVPPHVD